jgi:hypothetical protein
LEGEKIKNSQMLMPDGLILAYSDILDGVIGATPLFLLFRRISYLFTASQQESNPAPGVKGIDSDASRWAGLDCSIQVAVVNLANTKSGSQQPSLMGRTRLDREKEERKYEVKRRKLKRACETQETPLGCQFEQPR